MAPRALAYYQPRGSVPGVVIRAAAVRLAAEHRARAGHPLYRRAQFHRGHARGSPRSTRNRHRRTCACLRGGLGFVGHPGRIRRRVHRGKDHRRRVLGLCGCFTHWVQELDSISASCLGQAAGLDAGHLFPGLSHKCLESQCAVFWRFCCNSFCLMPPVAVHDR